MRDLVVTVSVSSVFSGLMCSESVVFLCPFKNLCPALSSGVNYKATARGSFSHLRPLLAARPGCPMPPVVEGWHLGTVSLLHSMRRLQGWGHLRANLGFGVFWFISPLLVTAYLPPTSFIGRIFFSLSGLGPVWV